MAMKIRSKTSLRSCIRMYWFWIPVQEEQLHPFVENGQGDVLIAWENEAYLSVKDYPDDYEIITPSISILAQPSVAVVDTVSR